MTTRTKGLTALVALSLSLVIVPGCTSAVSKLSNNPLLSSDTAAVASGQVLFRMELPSDARQVQSMLDAVDHIGLSLTGANIATPMSAAITKTQIVNNVASATFNNVPLGLANLTASIFDASGSLLASGSANVTVMVNQTAAANITLQVPPTGPIGVNLKIVDLKGYSIQAPSGAPLTAVAIGDAAKLKVVQVFSDNSTADLPANTPVVWNSPVTVVAAQEGGSVPAPWVVATSSAYPTTAHVTPEAFFAQNPTSWAGSTTLHTNDTAGVLWVADMPAAPIAVQATVTGLGIATASVDVNPAPVGNATAGQVLWGAGGFNCASCHGSVGQQTTPYLYPTYAATMSTSPVGWYQLPMMSGGATFSYKAQALNGSSGWITSAGRPYGIWAVGVRLDTNEVGSPLKAPMPNFLSQANPVTHLKMTGQDVADLRAYMVTQTATLSVAVKHGSGATAYYDWQFGTSTMSYIP